MDRLTGLDASFLALEKDGAHMHVGSVLIFEGPAPDYEDFVARIEGGLHLVPRYRQRLAFPPYGVARPGVGRRPALQRRATTCATPRCRRRRARTSCDGSRGACSPSSSTARSRCGRSGSSTSSADGRFALICKTHHALVDGISGVDIMTVLFDLEPDPPEPRARRRRGRRGRCRAARSCSHAVAGRPRGGAVRLRALAAVAARRRPAPTRAAPSPGWRRWPRRGSRARRPRR